MMAKSYPELWERYSAIHEAAGSAENKLGDCQIQLERVSSLSFSSCPLSRFVAYFSEKPIGNELRLLLILLFRSSGTIGSWQLLSA